jgi:hypothetical protein
MYEKLEDTKGVIRNHKSKDKTIKWQKKKDKQRSRNLSKKMRNDPY